MSKVNFSMLATIVVISLLLPGCQAIGDIFKAGVWSGIIIVVLIVALIIYFFSRSRK